MDQNISFATVETMRTLLDSGQITATQLLEHTLSEISRTNPTLNSFVLITESLARTQAEAADVRIEQGKAASPIDGIPIAVKDLYDTAGIVTAGGTAAFEKRTPDYDSYVVDKLQRAGALIVGKTNTHELALGGTTNNPHYGPTHNPWNLENVPGGSSGGSGAALASGQVSLALGTDTGGSVRIPSAFCGVTGHKPTYGLIGKSGIIPLSKTLDHAGPMARSAFDCALLLNQMTGRDINDPHNINFDSSTDFTQNIEKEVKGITLAIIPSLLVDSELGVTQSFTKSIAVLEQMGVNITEIEPTTNSALNREDTRRYNPEINWGDPLPAIIRSLSPILLSEGSTYIEKILRTQPHLIGEAVRARMMKGIDISVHDYIRALDWRKEIEGRFENCLLHSTIDGYIVPTSPQVAETITSDPHVGIEPAVKFRNTSVFNHTRQPSISVPNGFSIEGLPTGLMITTAQKNDALALRIAHQYQLNTDFHLSRPATDG
jgi:aspartyl-tRNA(Asn)/glutamyl-tRNA(Gln) amidotransferase subunit A